MNGDKIHSIFICEDDEFVCGLYASLLEHLPFSLDFFDSVESLLLKLKNKTPDLIITDMDLKQEKDGCDLIQKVRRKYEMPIFLVTGGGDKRVKEALKLPKVELIQKPIGNPHGFMRKVCAVFDGEHVLSY